jgi:alpha-beta hydrolase superfamily lysophospholipase
VIVIVHGYAEHSGRYAHVGDFLAERGYAVHAFDLRGHGRSPGPRVFVRSFDEYLTDLRALASDLTDRYHGAPLALLGHSMGGTIVALAAAERDPRVDAVLLSGAGLPAPGRGRRLMVLLLRLVGRFFPRLRLIKLKAADVSRDPEVVRMYDEDPLVYRGRMPMGLLSAMFNAGRRIDAETEQVDAPLLAMHGTADALTQPEGSRRFVDRASSHDKTLRLYDGLYHEILNEPERERVLADIGAWLDARFAPAPPK